MEKILSHFDARSTIPFFWRDDDNKGLFTLLPQEEEGPPEATLNHPIMWRNLFDQPKAKAKMILGGRWWLQGGARSQEEEPVADAPEKRTFFIPSSYRLPALVVATLLLGLIVSLATLLPRKGDHQPFIFYDPVKPPSYPLAVRNPYLSAWLPGNDVEHLSSAQAQFWDGQALTWSVIVRVDDVAYNLFGVPHPQSHTHSATIQTATYTSTHSVFSVTAGSANFKLDFLSPVSPSNYLRQSLPFSTISSLPSLSEVSGRE